METIIYITIFSTFHYIGKPILKQTNLVILSFHYYISPPIDISPFCTGENAVFYTSTFRNLAIIAIPLVHLRVLNLYNLFASCINISPLLPFFNFRLTINKRISFLEFVINYFLAIEVYISPFPFPILFGNKSLRIQY